MDGDLSDVGRPPSDWVAVVDDHPSIREVLTRVLHLHGISVESFSSAEEYLSFRQTALPRCLVLDVNLPGMSGLELHEKLAARHASPPPTIFISALDDIAFSNVVRTGAVSFLLKPFGIDALMALVKPHLTNGAVDEGAGVSQLHSSDQSALSPHAGFPSHTQASSIERNTA